MISIQGRQGVAVNSWSNGATVWIPATQEEKDAVRQQMERLLQTTHFRNSRRYPALFRYLVEETLEGRGDQLKERTLGVEVFGRPANYDTSTDPIVRVTIAEIRKRIAQYYHEEAHDSEMRIELTPGSYEPEFRPRQNVIASSEAIASPSVPDPIDQAIKISLKQRLRISTRSLFHRWVWWQKSLLVLIVTLLLFFAGTLGWHASHPSAIDQFWSPLMHERKSITFCIPDGAAKDGGATPTAAGIMPSPFTNSSSNSAASPASTFLDYETLGQNVVFSDALATLRISNWLVVRKIDMRYRLTTSTSLDDLRLGPNVLIGGLDNQWTLRAVAHLPYRFAGADREHFWIIDAKAPANRDWNLNLKTQWADITRDYAIIARLHDEATGQVEVIVAGIGMSGTAAAGEFLIDPAQMENLRRNIGPGFKDHDFEAVLSTDVVDGVAGAPRILRTAVW